MAPVEYIRVLNQAINRYAESGEQTSIRLQQMMKAQLDKMRHAQYLLLTGLLAVLMAVLITRSVTRPFKEAVDVARRVAAGDLTAQLTISGSNEMVKLLNALMQMQ
ncbi:hypothetical protein ACJ2_40190 [Pantoea sp. QMID2]|nr:hypothetical protein ACJ3_40140 [Pantoea sp. QMID3]GME46298.1 hypothetical protein ACJ1_39900 [Pantoea sp. QMID1]GME61740.1 hypothetical protein ACJ4_40940 [Pantoea sp. QMID4]GME63030.1 hypothetical protein ACJ2_40190 [Pantoea sp. QMID2]